MIPCAVKAADGKPYSLSTEPSRLAKTGDSCFQAELMMVGARTIASCCWLLLLSVWGVYMGLGDIAKKSARGVYKRLGKKS